MKKIIINGRFLTQRTTGVQRYAKEMLFELDKLTKPGELEIAIPPEVNSIPDYQNIKAVKIGWLKSRLWEHISFPYYVRKQGGISLNLCNVSPLIDPGIVCIHDVKIKATPYYFSKMFLIWYGMLFKNEIKRAKLIITVSEFSKKEIIKFYGVNKNKVYVIPNAWQHYKRIEYDDKALLNYNLEKRKYYFAMGSLEPNKNFKWVAEVAKIHPTHTFAVAGSINKKVFADGLGFDCPDNMKLLGYVSDEEAKTLMRDCKAFLFPTFYEGFGIPPLEAISAGARQVVVSDTDVMHEIFQDCVNYIDPNNYDINLKKLDLIVNKDNTGVLSKYSWSKSAKKLYELIAERYSS